MTSNDSYVEITCMNNPRCGATEIARIPLTCPCPKNWSGLAKEGAFWFDCSDGSEIDKRRQYRIVSYHIVKRRKRIELLWWRRASSRALVTRVWRCGIVPFRISELISATGVAMNRSLDAAEQRCCPCAVGNVAAPPWCPRYLPYCDDVGETIPPIGRSGCAPSAPRLCRRSRSLKICNGHRTGAYSFGHSCRVRCVCQVDSKSHRRG